MSLYRKEYVYKLRAIFTEQFGQAKVETSNKIVKHAHARTRNEKIILYPKNSS